MLVIQAALTSGLTCHAFSISLLSVLQDLPTSLAPTQHFHLAHYHWGLELLFHRWSTTV